MTRPQPLIVGNWKMFGRASSVEVLAAIETGLEHSAPVEVAICPPFTLLALFAPLCRAVRLGAQDCNPRPDGPHTGEVNAAMLADFGVRYVIVGHSERRADQAETDAQIADKVTAAQSHGLTPILCVGESRTVRESGHAEAAVSAQLQAGLPDGVGAPLVIAYEPIWAIGTGLVPTTAEIAQMHAALRQVLNARLGAASAGVRILYGGSVKPAGAAEILATAGVDGALVGGASLVAQDFLSIIRAAPAAGAG